MVSYSKVTAFRIRNQILRKKCIVRGVDGLFIGAPEWSVTSPQPVIPLRTHIAQRSHSVTSFPAEITFDKDAASCRPQPPLDLLRRKPISANSGKVLYHDTLSASTINGIQKGTKPRPFEGKPVCKIMKHPHNCMSMTLCGLFQAAEMAVHQLPVHIIWTAAVYTMINKNLHSASPFPNGACTIFPTPSGAFHTVFIRPSSNT